MKGKEKKRMTKEEYMATLPPKISKLGEWILAHYDDPPMVDYDEMTKAEKASFMRAVLK